MCNKICNVLARVTFIALVPFLYALQAQADVITIAPFEFDSRSAWAETIESESSAVVKSGSWSNFNVAPGAWNSGTWLFSTGSYAQANFSALADTLLVQFESDSNDGLAEFIVDGVSVGVLDTFNGGWFQAVISGLSLSAHTLRVVAAGAHPGTAANDVAIDVFGAVVSNGNHIPEPGTLALFALGLAGLAVVRRKRSA